MREILRWLFYIVLHFELKGPKEWEKWSLDSIQSTLGKYEDTLVDLPFKTSRIL